MDQVTFKLADCDNKTYRDCLDEFYTSQTVSSALTRNKILWRHREGFRFRHLTSVGIPINSVLILKQDRVIVIFISTTLQQR